MENQKIIWATIGVLAGGALLYYLSKDNSVVYDPKIHTDEKINEALDEIKLELTCIYVRHLNLIRKMLDAKTWKQQEFSHDLKAQVKRECADKTQAVLQSYNLSEEIVSQYAAKNLARFEQEEKYFAHLSKAVFEDHAVDHLCYEKLLPKSFTKELYLHTYRKIFDTLRHDLYVLIKQKQKETGGKKLPEEKVLELWGEVWKTFEDVRVEIFNLMLGSNVSQKEAKRDMQRAYVTFASAMAAHTDQSHEKVTSRWADLVTEIANNHAVHLKKMEQGILLDEEHEQDPRKTKEDIVTHQHQNVVYQPHVAEPGATVTEKKVVTKQTAKFANSFMDKIVAKREEKLAAAQKQGVEEGKPDDKTSEDGLEQPATEVKPEVLAKEENNQVDEVKAKIEENQADVISVSEEPEVQPNLRAVVQQVEKTEEEKAAAQPE